MNRAVVIIPSRYGSTRFPGKSLADLGGEPLVVRVAQRAALIKGAERVIVATDDRRIMTAVRGAGFDCVMTGEHASGSDRVGEAAADLDAGIVVNLQGDEPLFEPDDGDRLIAVLEQEPDVDIATLGHPFDNEADWRDPNAVKVRCDASGRALEFTRAAEGDPAAWRKALRHVGVYAYRSEALKRFLDLPPAASELREGLEQLRAMEAGMNIRVLRTDYRAVGVDTPEDLRRILDTWQN
jgi:3-deoxy-manno-octulosonate cytidylyltransferase (CMP-KDO synthetase)